MANINMDDVIGSHSTIARDLQLNFERLVGDGALGQETALLVVVATARATATDHLLAWAKGQLETLGVAADQIHEAEEAAAIMGMLNTYYRFRHFIGSREEYAHTGLRMTSLAKPTLGKEKFELLALAVSIVNGCEKCVVSHEKALRDLGVPHDHLHDVARLSAVVKGASQLVRT